ncbi:uncharacterized protein B0H18DRAFT_104328 [Fomitopsis serialis]|uniref:uncharacterized protein n=1 Tax=Fomitopsis serialis TaxID=139415 RepID=UPI002007B618|nr:uncharacterized protein B0H18DRAFT_104328 [Neoantrodia serialis]KAH9931322.1 hypothetical protein B0H18DRAFT_104328 [Neoantrodia serialis]
MLVAFLESMAEFLVSTRIVMVQVCIHEFLAQAWDAACVQPSLDRLANAVPSLRYLSLGIGGQPYDDTLFIGKVWWWRVKEEIASGIRVLSALETDAGQRLSEHQCTPGWSFDSDHYTLLSTTQKGQHEQELVEVLPPH